MLSQWPIRNKLLIGLGLLVLIVATLFASGSYGLYAYRGLVKSLSARSTELPVAAELGQQVSDLRVTLSEIRGLQGFSAGESTSVTDKLNQQVLRDRFRLTLNALHRTLTHYHDQLSHNIHLEDVHIGDDGPERQTLAQIDDALQRIEAAERDQAWLLDEVKVGSLVADVERLHELSAELPNHLRARFHALADDVRLHYRTAIILTWTTTIAAMITFAVLLRLFYAWIFRPLRVLIDGSRMVAQGRFGYRIHLQTRDEMSELADAMNDMTSRFEAIRDDLDRQVRERTKQVVRSEQLASVGFLAAGVAHEINNPLASIAMCSESLESRVAPLLSDRDEQHEVIRSYLHMIQQEAFRCKVITEKLLDFSRTGEVRRQRTELRELVQGVIEMVGHMGRYQNKQVALLEGELVFAELSPQEIKQVVLNLITNGLDSLDAGGSMSVTVRKCGDQAELVFTDDGCGMSDEVLKHLFEPFFTRRRGGQGTGLGLSISYRIIADHHGNIEAHSDGPGKGSRFVVTLPLADQDMDKEASHRYQAA